MSTREDMTISRFGRGTCPVCDRSIALMKDGSIRRRGDKTSWPPKDCVGSRQKPKEN